MTLESPSETPDDSSSKVSRMALITLELQGVSQKDLDSVWRKLNELKPGTFDDSLESDNGRTLSKLVSMPNDLSLINLVIASTILIGSTARFTIALLRGYHSQPLDCSSIESGTTSEPMSPTSKSSSKSTIPSSDSTPPSEPSTTSGVLESLAKSPSLTKVIRF